MGLSIIIPAHNEERIIGKCLESLLNQTVIPDSIIVSCDNCTDKTIEMAKKYERVIVTETVDNKKNNG